MASLVERLAYIATILLANKDKFAVPDHISAKSATITEAADRITALEAMCETLAGALEEAPIIGRKEAAWDFQRRQNHWLLKQYDQALTQYRAMKERNDG